MEFNLFQGSPIPKFPIAGVWDTVADVPTGAVVLDGGVVKQAQYRHKIYKLIPFIDLIGTRRIDVAGVGDSNQMLGGYGWDSGVPKALITEGNVPYQTPLFGYTENNNNGSGSGYLTSVGSGTNIPIVAFPPQYAKYAFTLGNADEYISPTLQGIYSASGDVYPKRVFYNNFMQGVGTARYHGRIGQTASSGSWRGRTRLEQSPFTTIYSSPSDVAFETGSDLYDVSFDTTSVDFSLPYSSSLGGSGTIDVSGEFFGLFQKVEHVENTTGFGFTTIVYRGGVSSRVVASALQFTHIDAIKEILFNMVRHQIGDKVLMIRICEGMNDRNDSDNSVGQNPAPSNTTAGFKDNVLAIMVIYKTAWMALGYDLNNLYFLLTPSHQPDMSDTIAPFRTACSELADEEPNTGYYNFAKDFTYTDMSTNGYYFPGEESGSAHLSTTGYDALALKEIQEVFGKTKELVPV